MKKIVFIPVIIAVIFSVYYFTPEESQGDNGLNYFLIGVWAQPPRNDDHADNFGFWKSIGVNTLVGHDSGPQKKVTIQEWDSKAQAAGLKVIRLPSNDPSYDLNAYKNGPLVALMVPDENDKIAANKGKWDASSLQLAVLNYTDSIRTKTSSVPVFMNFMGSQFGYNRDNWYKQAIQNVDFYSYDWYPFNTGYEVYTTLVERMQKITYWSGKYSLAYIETSDQHLKKDPANQNPAYSYRVSRMRGPTPQEIRMEMAVSVAQGAPGLIFFADTFYPFEYDGTTQAGVDMIKQETAIWNKLTADPGQPIVNLPDGLVGQRRMYNGSYAKIVANYTDKTITVGNQTFGPYDYKILNDSVALGTVVVSRPMPKAPDASPNTSTGSGSSNGGSNSGGSQTPTPNPQSTEISVTCSATRTSAHVGDYVSWYVRANDAKYPITYTWSEPVDYNTSYFSKSYSTTGTKQMSVVVKSADNQTKTVQCENVEISEVPLITSCNIYVIPESSSQVRVIWSSYAYGGTNNYTYSWSGTDNLSGSKATIEKVYTSGDMKNATVRITSGNQSVDVPCRVTLPQQLSTVSDSYCNANPYGSYISWQARGGSSYTGTTYNWSTDGSTATQSYMYAKYSSSGLKVGNVTISDSTNNSTMSMQCAATADIS